MNRTITKAEYTKEAKSNPKCLDLPRARSQGVILETGYIIVVKNKFPYTKWRVDANSNTYKEVKEHYLIIPTRNSPINFSDLHLVELEKIQEVITDLNREARLSYPTANIDVMFCEKGKSIKKFHIHYIIYSSEELHSEN
jgi:diadenosine tetraphosphate (Ap4A) HIT family hydrolase